jgi:integrase/recombinase XerD
MASNTRLYLQQNVRSIASEFDAFLADAGNRRGRSANRLASCRCDLLATSTLLTDFVDLITLALIESFLASHKEAPSTSNRRIARLRQFFRCAQRQGYRPDNPVDLVETKPDKEKLPRLIKGGDLKALDKVIVAAPQSFRETGIRADEILNLHVGDCTLNHGREGPLVREPKNN